MKTEWFIVRHKPTGAYLHDMGWGHWYWAPLVTVQPNSEPCLFSTEHGAKQAIIEIYLGHLGDENRRYAAELEVCVVELNA